MVCEAGRYYKGSSHSRWAHAGGISSIELGRKREDLCLRPQATRSICLWVVRSLQIPAQTNVRVQSEPWTPETQTRQTWCTFINSVHTSTYELQYSKYDEWTNVDHVVHAGSHRRSNQDLSLPTGIRYPGKGNPGCGTGRVQRETGPRVFEFLLSPEATGTRRSITDGPLLCWEWTFSRYQL